ncbi:uncharacterized protein LOC129598948 [Paramacrobiotus metropolitanus]|uniref:uncharacterized protein LOC129598948 n=1 Tax=Paramacrobiotus metropolitanus TaxID=2943436 RepID=UPI00244580F3|nr:uncharacterized protein LOC129598948 [Paramacrobiotus metropolitanus]
MKMAEDLCVNNSTPDTSTVGGCSDDVQLPASLFSDISTENPCAHSRTASGLPQNEQECITDMPVPTAYSDRLKAALRAVESGIMTRYAAAKRYNVPYTTLWEKLNGVRRGKLGAHMRKFTDEEENYIESLLLKCAENGIPLDKRFLKRIVPILASNKDMPVNRKTFTKFWHRQFLKRHPKISQRFLMVYLGKRQESGP